MLWRPSSPQGSSTLHHATQRRAENATCIRSAAFARRVDMPMTDRVEPERAVDTAQRTFAIDPHESAIVQAPAGSGKTALLVERFVNLLEFVDAPEEILAITFTRKAA